jgi:putative membrane-bound dehydrogenase-like protein
VIGRSNVVTALSIGLFAVSPLIGADDSPAPLSRIAPLEPGLALKSFAVKDEFALQLIAAEPLVTDPVAGVYDERGRLFIVEMNDYPYTDKSTDKPNVERTNDLPIGKVRLLVDTDDDGIFDQSEIFARDLSWPTGIAVFDGGVFVAATPDLWYLKDTDGDNICDVRTKVFSGFRKFNVQAVVNNLIWGLDHRIYGAGGSNGGAVRSWGDSKSEPVALSRHDFRFDPRTPNFELQSGSARFGNCFDDWGHRFICNIRNPIQHVLLPLHYLSRNPFLPVNSALNDVALAGDQIRVYRSSPPEPWRVVNADRLTTQGDPRMPRSEKNAAGFMTSACSVTVYRGDAYPNEFRQQVFLAEPSGNLVHRQKLTSSGVTFTSERIDQESEFVASSDNWFRPVNFVPAPDGTLHLLDMYRETIEHPWSMPDDLKAMLDLESGRDRGRIYRVVPPGFKRRPTPNLAAASTEQLIELLEHPNVWHRETAHRLIHERQDAQCVTSLRKLRNTTTNSLARLHALWSLHGLGQLDENDLQLALNDTSGDVREHAVRLTEEFLQRKDSSELREQILRLAQDSEPNVRFQVAFTLGTMTDSRRGTLLEAIARRDADDPWITTAVLSSSVDLAPQLLTSLLNEARNSSDSPLLPLMKQLAQVTGARNRPEELAHLANQVAALSDIASDTQLSVLLALDDGLRRKGTRIDLAWAKIPSATAIIDRHASIAKTTVVNPEDDLQKRIAAIRVLACQPLTAIQETLFSLLELKHPQELRVAAVRTLTGYHQDGLGEQLLARFAGATPPVQYEIIEALANHPQRLPILLDAIADGKIAASQVTPLRRMLLLNHADETVRRRAKDLIGLERSTPRASLVQEYKPMLEKHGDRTRGLKVYMRECATCHKIGDQGYEVGPNLATIRHRRPEEILIAILDPNREVGPNFLQYAVAMDDGRTLGGIIAEETASSLTLKRADNKQDLLLRTNVAEISGTGLSLMPEGLEKRITQLEMADLIAFLRGN